MWASISDLTLVTIRRYYVRFVQSLKNEGMISYFFTLSNIFLADFAIKQKTRNICEFDDKYVFLNKKIVKDFLYLLKTTLIRKKSLLKILPNLYKVHILSNFSPEKQM